MLPSGFRVASVFRVIHIILAILIANCSLSVVPMSIYAKGTGGSSSSGKSPSVSVPFCFQSTCFTLTCTRLIFIYFIYFFLRVIVPRICMLHCVTVPADYSLGGKDPKKA